MERRGIGSASFQDRKHVRELKSRSHAVEMKRSAAHSRLQRTKTRFRGLVPALLVLLSSPSLAFAQTVSSSAETARDMGVSSLWILANFSYAGMRAQNSRSAGWRIISFIFGFPGTLLSLLLIRAGSERAYGVDVPRRRPPEHQSYPGAFPRNQAPHL